MLCCCTAESPRVVEDFNFDWRFTLGDDASFAQADFDDSGWRGLHLPHDWSIEGEFSADNPSTPGGGALPGGIGWYRKTFETPKGTDSSRKVYLEFDGVFMNSTVYVNGKEVGTRPYGYSSFSYDITDVLNPSGKDNLVAVRCDNADQPNSRWYAGCGIYRDVRLVQVDESHVAYNGVYVTTPSVSAEKASVHVEATVEGDAAGKVAFKIVDAEGRREAFAEGRQEGGVWSADLTIDNPHLWDIDDTYQYSIITYVLGEKKIHDACVQKFGVRTATFDIEKGFFLNGRPVKLLGVCLHHDMGCLGTAVHTRALERELGILKEMGCNAIRTSHNPPAPQLLDLCDDMGFLVIDEAMDMWRKKKTQFDYARFFDEWHQADVQDFVRRDRNHPCVIMWSIGNEILEQWDSNEDDDPDLSAEQANLLMNFIKTLPQYQSGKESPQMVLTRHMADLVRELDTTRPITSGCNETQPYNNLLKSGALDVYGFNYHTWDYDKVREWYPDKPLYGSETASSLNTRGYYPQPSTEITKEPVDWRVPYETPHHQCPAYDNMCAPWGDLHEHAWTMIRDRDYMAGTFIWTGFDYLGEPTPYTWPSRSSYFGIVDLAGFPKDIYYMYQAEWTDKTVLHLFPHWNWKEGDIVDIWAYYNNADEVELFVNGKSAGKSRKEGERLHAQWLGVPYEFGQIEAVSYKDGKEVARKMVETIGEGISDIRLTPDREVVKADGYDLCYVTVEALDAAGRPNPKADMMLDFRVVGNAELVGIDNGDPTAHYCLKGDRMPLFAGKAIAVIRSLRGKEGPATLIVTSEELNAKINIKCK